MNENSSKHLKRKWLTALLALLIAFAAMASATFAWYIYNTNAHTTSVHMAAGSSTSIKISSSYNGEYSTSTGLTEFNGSLNPVSTDNILKGFQKVYGFTDGSENQPNLVANLFGAAESTDYYMTSLYIKADADDMKVYLSDIGYVDSDKNNPISTAIRIGLVTHEAGENQPTDQQYIFAINTGDNPEAEYNTAAGTDGQVLDSSTFKEGVYNEITLAGDNVPLISFTPYTSENFCGYNSDTGAVSVKADSVQICTLNSDGNGNDGDAVQVDVYIWLEGCDKDCTSNLCSQTLKNLAISFCGTCD